MADAPRRGLSGSRLSQRPSVLRLISLVTLPFVVLATVSVWRGMQESESRVAEERMAVARAAALTADAAVEGSTTTLRILARTRSITLPSSNPDLGGFLNQARETNPDWDFIGLFDEEGWAMTGAGIQPRSLNVADRDYFQMAMSTGAPAVSEAFVSRLRGIQVVVVAVPVEFASGGRGVLAAGLSLAALQRELEALPQERSIQIAVVDSNGRAFLHPDPDIAAALTSLRGRPDVEAVLGGETGSQQVDTPEGHHSLVAYAPVRHSGWGVLVTQPTSAAFATVRRQLAEQLALIGLAAILALLIGWNLGGRLTRLYQRELDARSRAEAAAVALRAISRESESRRRFLEGLIATAPVAIAVLKGPEHRYVTVNPAYQAIKPGAQMLGRTVADVFPELARQGHIKLLDRVYTTGEQFTATDRRTRIDDGISRAEDRYFTVVFARYDDPNQQPEGVLVIATETTEAVLARQRSEREKDEFLAMASHELKTPISSLLLAAQMIQRMLSRGSLDEERVERLAKGIGLQATRASGLINDLLDVSRLQDGRLQPSQEPVDLVQLAEAAAQRERDTLPEGDPHEIVVQRSEPSSIIVMGDEPRLDQVLTNLLSNAVKYSPQGGRVEVQLAARDGQAIFCVADQGIGIPQSERAVVFSPFHRTAAAHTSGITGTGLGLYITRRIVEAHGGDIRIEDTPGGGTTFTVTFPLAKQ